TQQVVVGLEIASVIPEPLGAEIGLSQPIALPHRPHRAIEDEQPFREQFVQPVECGHAYRLDLACPERSRGGFGIRDLECGIVLCAPLAISTANGSAVLLASTCTRTPVRFASLSSVPSSDWLKP